MTRTPEPDDSIDLLELAAVLWARRLQVVVVTLTFVAAGTAYALLATPLYRAEVVLAPREAEPVPGLLGGLGGLANLAGINIGGSANETQSIATLRSRAFIEEFIEDNSLLPVLFADEWDATNGSWQGNDPESWPDIRDGVEFFTEEVRTISEDAATGLVTLAIEWTDPDLAAAWAEQLVLRINDRLRTRELANSARRLEYLNAELEKASLVELRQAIARLIENEVEAAMLAQAESEYAFIVIDPARVPHERDWPRRTLIVFFAAIIGGMIAVAVALTRWRVSIAAASRMAESKGL